MDVIFRKHCNGGQLEVQRIEPVVPPRLPAMEPDGQSKTTQFEAVSFVEAEQVRPQLFLIFGTTSIIQPIGILPQREEQHRSLVSLQSAD